MKKIVAVMIISAFLICFIRNKNDKIFSMPTNENLVILAKESKFSYWNIVEGVNANYDKAASIIQLNNQDNSISCNISIYKSEIKEIALEVLFYNNSTDVDKYKSFIEREIDEVFRFLAALSNDKADIDKILNQKKRLL